MGKVLRLKTDNIITSWNNLFSKSVANVLFIIVFKLPDLSMNTKINKAKILPTISMH